MLPSRKLLLGIILVFLPRTVSANGLTPPVIGGNFAGPVELNPSAVYWNPGTLGQLKGTNIFFDIAPTYFLSSYTSARYPTEVSSALFSPVPILGISSDFGLKSLTFAFGIYPAFGGSTDWPANTPQRYQAVSANIQSINVTPAVSWNILPNLSLGAGASYIYNTLDVKMSQDMYTDLTSPGSPLAGSGITPGAIGCSSPESPGCEVRADLKNNQGSAIGWNAGVFYRPINDLSLGLSYESQVMAQIKGDITLTSPPGTFMNTLFQGKYKGKSTLDYTLPQMVNFGARYRAAKAWSIDAIFRWINWKVHKNFLLAISGPSTGSSAVDTIIFSRREIVRGFQDALSARLGTIYSGLGWWRIMGAVGYDQSGIPDSTMSASNLEFDKVYLAVAFEHYFTRAFKIGAGINHAFLFQRKITNSTLAPSGNANGTYTGSFLDVIDVSAAYHF